MHRNPLVVFSFKINKKIYYEYCSQKKNINILTPRDLQLRYTFYNSPALRHTGLDIDHLS